MMKVDLLREPWKGWHNSTRGPVPTPIVRSLPYMQSKKGKLRYVHRIRSGLLHLTYSTAFDGGRQVRLSETAENAWLTFRLWCGVSLTPGSLLLPEPPPGANVCATCEGRAVGAGMPSSSIICRRPIIFRPHRTE